MSKIDKDLKNLELCPERTLEEVNLSNDFLFAKTMEDKEICKSVLEEILKRKIREVRQPITQKSLKVNEISKGIRLDVFVEDENNTIFNIEMQTSNNPNLAKRTRYYQGIIDSSLIQIGADYADLNKTYIIFICTFDPFKRGKYQYTFRNTCQEESNLILEDDSIKLFLNTKGKKDDVSDALIGFLKYVENSTEDTVKEYNSPLVESVARRVKKVKENRELRREFMTLERKLREERKEGEEIGKLKNARENAKALLDLLNDEVIAERIKLPIEEVRQLRKECEVNNR